MKNLVKLFTLFGLSMLIFLPNESCKHQRKEVVNPVDTTTTGGGGTGGGSTGSGLDSTGWRCSPDTVYFQNDVLPIIISKCATAGCHDAVTRADGYQLTSYATIVSKGVSAGRATNSKLYTEIANGKMPPPSSGITMTQAQKDIIAKWINQGAKNLTCNPNYGSCDTVNVKYSTFILPLIQNKCLGCHTSGTNSVANYTAVRTMALNGKLYGSVNHATGFRAMPDASPKLPTCEINKIQAWIKAGALNN